MKKLIQLGDLQSDLLREILRQQSQYYAKRVSKFNVITEVDEISEIATHYLCTSSKLDAHYYGNLMYMLGMAIQKEFSKK